MSRSARRHVSGLCFVAALACGCGGATLAEEQVPRADGGEPRDATRDATRTSDSARGLDVIRGVDVAVQLDAGCTADPTEGTTCDPGVSTACAQPGDPCCIGYVWTCNSATRTWVKEGLGCACIIDAGVSRDSGVTRSDASDECGGCVAGDVCVVQTTSGGACMRPGDGGICPNGTTPPPGGCCDDTTVTTACEPRPASCGTKLTCGCAASLCKCQCMSTIGTTVECACDYP